MINIENIVLHDDLNESYDSQYGLEYKGYIFIFETIAERDFWIDKCSEEYLDYIIESDSVSDCILSCDNF